MGTLERDRSARTIDEAFFDSTPARLNLLDATTVQLRSQRPSLRDPTSQDEIEEIATHPYRELVGALA